ncbi:MAG: adenylate kinase [DPANN group archaeon]|nr:adenylate kinase [DPANN group archaeon]
MENKIIIVTGIPGVGKSRVINDAMNLTKNKYIIKTFGTEMFNIAKKESLVKTRDDMRKLNNETQKTIQVLAAKNISKASEISNIILDTHSTIETPNGYLPGLPIDILTHLIPKTIVIIESDEKDIIKRRQNDSNRKRDNDSIIAIKRHQELNRSFCAAYSMFTDAILTIITNKEDKSIETAKKLAKILD